MMSPACLLPILAAPFVGSLLGVLIRRLPRGEPVVIARSCCESCGRALGPFELVPLLSHMLLRGRCLTCRAPIPPLHWQVELAAVLVAAWAVLASGADVGRAWAACVLGWTLLALAWIDLRTGQLHDVLTLPLVVAGLLATAIVDPDAVTRHAIGAVVGYAAFSLLAIAYRAWRKRDGLGRGDAKLLAAAGAWVGPVALGDVVVIAALAGLATALLRRPPGEALVPATAVPFGPGLALGTWLVRLHGVSFG